MLAVGGKSRSTAIALDQSTGSYRLQAAYVLTDGSLTEVQRLGGPLETAAIGDRHQAAQRDDRQNPVHVYQGTRQRSRFVMDPHHETSLDIGPNVGHLCPCEPARTREPHALSLAGLCSQQREPVSLI
jgi:hypothetical protein